MALVHSTLLTILSEKRSVNLTDQPPPIALTGQGNFGLEDNIVKTRLGFITKLTMELAWCINMVCL